MISVIAVGATLASAEADDIQSLNITDSGDAENLLLFENTHNISDVRIETNGTVDSNEYMTLYVNFKELQSAGVNMSKVDVINSTIINGNIAETRNIKDNGDTILTLRIKRLDLDSSVQIESVRLGGINGSKGKTTNNIQYRIGVVNNNSTSSYENLETSNKIRNSTKFDLVNGTVAVQDQGTVSTNFARSSRTSSGVTVSGLVADVNSTVVLTDPNNGEIVGYKSQTSQQMNGEGRISLSTSNLGGRVKAYLIPSKQINITQEDIDTELSDQSKGSAIAKDQAHVYLGTVQFENQKYGAGGSTNVSIATAEVRDTVGMNTPYIVSIHPVTTGGKVAYERYVGYSKILTGTQDNLKIPVRDAMGNNGSIWHSNQFVAVIRLAEGQKQGDSVDLNSTKILPNSDIKNQFVHGGISDSAEIYISNQDNVTRADRRFNRTKDNSDIIYSGETIEVENVTSPDTVRLHRKAANNQSIVSGIGIYSNSTDSILFNTTGLQTGMYSVSGGESKEEIQFKLVGKRDQKSNITYPDRQIKVGSDVTSELYHNTSKIGVRIFNPHIDRTLATANLSTPTPGRTAIGLNTYALGNESLTDSLITAGPNATVESVNASMPNGTLPPGEYRVSVRSERGLAETADEATVTVGNRSTNEMRAYATTDLDRDDLGTADAVRRAVANETLSPTATVTANETVVYAVDATGLTGLPAARNATPDTGADLAELDGLAFGVRSNDSTLATATDGDGSTVNGSVPRNSSVHVDESGLYLVAEGDDALATDDAPADGEGFTAEFRVADERLREAASAESDGEASTTVTFEAPPPTEEDADSGDDTLDGGGDGTGDDGGSGGGTDGGSGTGGDGGSGGGTGGGGGGGTGDGTATGGGGAGAGPTGATPPPGPSSGSAAGEQARGGDETRAPLKRDAGRFGIRPVADLRNVASDGSNGSPVTVPPAVGSVRGSSGSPADGAPSSETGAARGETGREGTDAAAEAPEAGEADPGTGSGAGDGPAAEPDATGADPRTPSYDDAPIRTTAEDLPGFGPLVTLVALLLAGRLAARRRGAGS